MTLNRQSGRAAAHQLLTQTAAEQTKRANAEHEQTPEKYKSNGANKGQHIRSRSKIAQSRRWWNSNIEKRANDSALFSAKSLYLLNI